MMPMATIKEVNLPEWIIKIEKRDPGIIFTCQRKQSMSCLHLQLYHIPQNMAILFDTIDDLWRLLRASKKFAIERNILRVSFQFNIAEREITFFLKHEESLLVKEIQKLKEENQRKDKLIGQLNYQVAFWKNRYEEAKGKKSIFDTNLQNNKEMKQDNIFCKKPQSLFDVPLNKEKGPQEKLNARPEDLFKEKIFGQQIKHEGVVEISNKSNSSLLGWLRGENKGISQSNGEKNRQDQKEQIISPFKYVIPIQKEEKQKAILQSKSKKNKGINPPVRIS